MVIEQVGLAGTLESSDLQVRVAKNEAKGLVIHLKSSVEKQFGRQILKVVEETCKELGVTDAEIQINDKGALDCVIRARLKSALHRASGNMTQFGWEV